MTLGQYLIDYREAKNLSQRQFALLCDVSNGYIAMIEKGLNPKTGKPIIPTLLQLKKLASGMGMSVSELVDAVDDMPISLSVSSPQLTPAPQPSIDLTTAEQILIKDFRALNVEGQQKLLEYASDLHASGRYIKTTSDNSISKQA